MNVRCCSREEKSSSRTAPVEQSFRFLGCKLERGNNSNKKCLSDTQIWGLCDFSSASPPLPRAQGAAGAAPAVTLLCVLSLCPPRRWCHQSVEELCRPGEEPGDGDGLAGALRHAAKHTRWVLLSFLWEKVKISLCAAFHDLLQPQLRFWHLSFPVYCGSGGGRGTCALNLARAEGQHSETSTCLDC